MKSIYETIMKQQEICSEKALLYKKDVIYH